MSVASPRPSISSAVRSPPSSRTSLDLTQSQPQRPTNVRRNRTALRDYYNLKTNEPEDQPRSAPRLEEAEVSELDKDGFDAAAYVKDLLGNQRLEDVLKIEGGLVSDIRGLDGERKALVYDNYSKLIAATDTIRKMRSNMEPLTPATSTLAPAVSHIAETAAALSADSSTRHAQTHNDQASQDREEENAAEENQNQVQTVRWVVDAPRRLSSMIAEGQRDDAEAEWSEVGRLLNRWRGVSGVEEVKKACEEVMQMPHDT